MTTEAVFVTAQRLAGPHPSTARNNALFTAVVPWDLVALGGNGTFPLITVAAGDVVLMVQNLVTTTVSGGQSPGIVVGDDGVTNRFLTTGVGTAVSTTPYQYSAANTIDMVAASGTTTGKGILVVQIYRP